MTGLIDLETEPIARAVVAELLRSWLRLHSNLEARSSDDWRANWTAFRPLWSTGPGTGLFQALDWRASRVGVTTRLRSTQGWAQPTALGALTGLGSKEEVAYCVRHGLMAALLTARRLVWECYPALVEAQTRSSRIPRSKATPRSSSNWW